MPRKSIESQLNDALRKKEQAEQALKNQKELVKDLQKKYNEKKRKERNNYLYKIGGAVNQVLKEDYGKEEFRPEDVENIIAFLKRQDQKGDYFINAMNRGPKPCGAVPQKQPEPDPKEEYVAPEPSYPDDFSDYSF